MNAGEDQNRSLLSRLGGERQGEFITGVNANRRLIGVNGSKQQKASVPKSPNEIKKHI